MKVVILYRPNSEYGTAVETFIHDFKLQHNAERLEVLDADSRDGTAKATLYDVLQFPAILAVSDNGSILKSWQGDNLPLMDDVAYYTQA